MKQIKYIHPDAISSGEIRAIRKKLNLTQAAFAEFVCVSKKTVERWESGKENVTGPIVTLISLLFKRYNSHKHIIKSIMYEIPEIFTGKRHHRLCCAVIRLQH
ncbi:MAG: helix-turn-helix domain-containing protein [Lachnospiraceae bacterium]|nr:helix-turn-helix domain-containing protein [Lachnospiraceae bacterium]